MAENESISDSEDVPQLSSETFAALTEFYKEQEEKEEKLKLIKNNEIPLNSVDFEENWQLSQFWYDKVTIDSLSSIAVKQVKEGKIALISCPSLYSTLKQLATNCEITLFEYDERFAAFGNDFVYYDYKNPLDVPRNLADSYDLVLADPPFLSEECLTKTAVTVKFLSKKDIILCTGSVMTELAGRLLNLKKCTFEPRHKNNLGNDFCCFANFDVDSLL